MRTPFIPFHNSETLNSKAGFKLIYNTMLATKDFHKAINVIFEIRKHNLESMKLLSKLLDVIIIPDDVSSANLTNEDYQDIANDIEADFQISMEQSGLF